MKIKKMACAVLVIIGAFAVAVIIFKTKGNSFSSKNSVSAFNTDINFQNSFKHSMPNSEIPANGAGTYGFMVLNSRGKSISSKSNHVNGAAKGYFSIINLSKRKNNAVLLAFDNGILMPVSIDGKKKTELFDIGINKGSYVDIPFEIPLNDYNNNVVFAVVLDRNNLPTSSHPHLCFFMQGFSYNYINSSSKNKSQSFKESDGVIHAKTKLSSQYKDCMSIKKSSDKTEMDGNNFISLSDAEKGITIQAIASKGDYAVYLFNNNKPVVINQGKLYYRVSVSGADDEITLNLKDIRLDKGQLYAAMVPADQKNSIIVSEKSMLQ